MSFRDYPHLLRFLCVLTAIAAICWNQMALIGATLLTQPEEPDVPAASISYNCDVRPILSDKCFPCHGADAGTREAGLRLDTSDSLLPLDSGGTAIVAGNSRGSLIMDRILTDDQDLKMPPAHLNKALTSDEIEILKTWIDAGAHYENHWAFEPSKRPEVPPTTSPSFANNPIDHFIQVKIDERGFAPSAIADKATLIRRVAIALTGLPPTIDEQNAYLSDESETAFHAMLDRYMESERYGEEMARHWLDVARYADTHGMHLDNERQMWAYRDWVIQAFNRNMPFDQFTIEQLAGDLLPDPSIDQLTATGFNRCNVTSSEGGSINEELLYRYAVDRASTTMQVWMGLTGGCAVCHDHKFDPISQKEFYSMYAFFNSAADPAMDGNSLLTSPIAKLDREEDRIRLAAIAERFREITQRIQTEAEQVTYTDPALEDPKPDPELTFSMWMDDEFPSGGTLVVVGTPTEFVEGSEPTPISGTKVLKRSDGGLAQDVWESKSNPVTVPDNGVFEASVWIDPKNTPRSIMVQFHREGWNHRAVWGDYEAINWGKVDSFERVHMGELPELGAWVQLRVPFDKLGLKAGDKLVGFALTQFGGTVYWDRVGASGSITKATDLRYSFEAWKESQLHSPPDQIASEIRDSVQRYKASKDAETAHGTAEEASEKELRRYFLTQICETTKTQFQKLNDEVAALNSERKSIEESIPGTFIYRDLPTPRESFVMLRGAYNKPGDPVQPGVLEILPPLKLDSEQRRATRLDLARWLVSGDHPLTARVTVNRFWQQFFGVGLVKSSYDFGTQGELPSHPELLDWLAIEFQESGWDVKHLVRLMLSSHTFQQSSRMEPQHLDSDPSNRLLARGPRFRLDAEQIRDNALFVAGILDLKMGGKGVKPYQPPNIWEPVGFAGSNTRFYSQDSGSSLVRRSIYTFYKRTAPPPFMSNFDAPNREQSCSVRERSNTPLQALQLMNDVQYVEAARCFAERLTQDSDEIDGGVDGRLDGRLELGVRMVLCRMPTDRELIVLRTLYQEQLERFQANPESANALLAFGDIPSEKKWDTNELAALTLVCNLLLNLDETTNRN
ncbi:PSD1 and planctomycete cytochrome C domain-containing protein [Pirellulaceae bacterium SH449]